MKVYRLFFVNKFVSDSYHNDHFNTINKYLIKNVK